MNTRGIIDTCSRDQSALVNDGDEALLRGAVGSFKENQISPLWRVHSQLAGKPGLHAAPQLEEKMQRFIVPLTQLLLNSLMHMVSLKQNRKPRPRKELKGYEE